MLPAERFERPEAARNHDRRVAAHVPIAAGVGPELFHGLPGAEVPGQHDQRPFRSVEVGPLECAGQLGRGLPGGRQRPLQFGQWWVGKVFLPLFEPIHRPEQGEEPLLRAHLHAHLVDRLDLVDVVIGIQPPDAGKEDAREESPVGKPELQLLDQCGHALAAGRLLDEPDDGLDVRTEPDLLGGWRGFFRSEGPQAAQRRHVGQTQRRGPRDRLQKPSACRVAWCDLPLNCSGSSAGSRSSRLRRSSGSDVHAVDACGDPGLIGPEVAVGTERQRARGAGEVIRGGFRESGDGAGGCDPIDPAARRFGDSSGSHKVGFREVEVAVGADRQWPRVALMCLGSFGREKLLSAPAREIRPIVEPSENQRLRPGPAVSGLCVRRPGGSGNSVTKADGVIRSIVPLCPVGKNAPNQRLPSAPTVGPPLPWGMLPAGSVYSVMEPLEVIRPIAPDRIAPAWPGAWMPNQRLPSRPTVSGPGAPGAGSGKPATMPVGVIRPIAPVSAPVVSANQRLPSGPTVSGPPA